MSRRARALLALSVLIPFRLAAQRSDTTVSPPRHVAHPPAVLGAPADEWRRLAELADTTYPPSSLLRSPSSWIAPGDGFRPLAPLVTIGRSAGMPLEENDGALWAGLGYSARAIAGFRADVGRFHLVFAPEAVVSQNHAYPLPMAMWYVGFPDSVRSPWAAPWYAGPRSADLPLRMGDRPLHRVELGQSAAYVDAGPVSLGAATENEWWGPGVRNAILLGDAAPGFLHAFARTRRPIATPAGVFEARWLVGGLVESRFFDANRANDVRSISMLAVTWTPPIDSGLTLGAARAVFAPARSWGRVFGDFYQVFSDVGTPNDRPASDSTITPGRDQLFSFFGRWVLPRDGFELWFEWARASQPKSLRDLLTDPSHSRGYTVGLQWLSPRPVGGGHPRVLTEMTYLEQSPSFRNRPEGWMYASRAVVQGYTNRGQPLGATFGVGGSSQYLELGWVRDSGLLLGATLTRVRYNDDAYNEGPASLSYCRHDVALLPGGRASWRSPVGDVALDYRAGLRMTPFFRYSTPNCNYSSPDDRRLSSLRLTVSPDWSGRGRRRE